MFSKDAEELSKKVPIGTKVVIANGPYGEFNSHQRVIIPGDRGSDVFAVQKRLKKLGFYRGQLDGVYGDTMKAALFKFYESKKIPLHNEIYRGDLKKMGLFLFE